MGSMENGFSAPTAGDESVAAIPDANPTPVSIAFAFFMVYLPAFP